MSAAEKINHAMARFPLILRILGELAESRFPLPGDDDVQHGCERALTRILSDLSRISPAVAGAPTPAEETATSWLNDPAASQLIDADRLERIQQLIDSILVPDETYR
jgi:hypothetical protein